MQVREFTSAAEMKAFYAALKGRPAAPVVLRRKPVPAVVARPTSGKRPSLACSIMTCWDSQHVPMRELLAATSRVTGVPVWEMTARFRADHIVVARHMFCWLARKYGAKSFPAIGKVLNRDHSTVMYGAKKIDANLAKHRATLSAIEVEAGL